MKYELPEHGTAERSVFQALELSAWYLLLAAALAVSAWVHALAGCTLPLPWDDEVSFLWPAVNVALHSSLLAPELNPDRPVMWMPPGFMVVCGLVFKVTGFSLDTARWVSWLFLAGAFVVLAFWLRRFPLRLMSLGLLSLMFVNGAFVCAGNIGRMDGLCLLLAAAGFLAIQRGRCWPGLVVLAVNPLVHPNGVYFLGAGIVAAVVRGPREVWRPRRLDWILIGVAGILWLAYAAQVVGYWDAFRSDMQGQMLRKAARKPMERLLTWPMPGYFAVYGLAGLVALVRRSSYTAPLAFGGTCLIVKVTGVEMWYEIFNQLALLLLGLAALWAVWELVRWWRPEAVPLRLAAVCLVALPVLLFHYRNGFIEGPRGYPRDLSWGWGMHMAGDTPYFTDADHAAVLAQLSRELPSGRVSRVAFYPRGDAFFFWNDRRDILLPFEPHFTTNRADFLVYRTSRHIPGWWSNSVALAKAAIPVGLAPFHERAGTERWFFVDLRRSAASADQHNDRRACDVADRSEFLRPVQLLEVSDHAGPPRAVVVPRHDTATIPQESQRVFGVLPDVVVGMGAIYEHQIHAAGIGRIVERGGVAENLSDLLLLSPLALVEQPALPFLHDVLDVAAGRLQGRIALVVGGQIQGDDLRLRAAVEREVEGGETVEGADLEHVGHVGTAGQRRERNELETRDIAIGGIFDRKMGPVRAAEFGDRDRGQHRFPRRRLLAAGRETEDALALGLVAQAHQSRSCERTYGFCVAQSPRQHAV